MVSSRIVDKEPISSSTPAENAGACEANRLAIGEPTRATAKLAYPSSAMGG